MFYDRFKILCKQKGVSCNKAAAEMGFSNATPTAWKKRGITPTGETLSRIADYFGVSTDYLLGNQELESGRISQRDLLQKELKDVPEVYLHLLQGAKKLDLDGDDVDMLLDVAARLKRKDREHEKELENNS